MSGTQLRLLLQSGERKALEVINEPCALETEARNPSVSVPKAMFEQTGIYIYMCVCVCVCALEIAATNITCSAGQPWSSRSSHGGLIESSVIDQERAMRPSAKVIELGHSLAVQAPKAVALNPWFALHSWRTSMT
jgi:hypothetical protein